MARGGEMLGMSVWCEWPAHRSLRSQVGAQVAGAGPGTGHPTPAIARSPGPPHQGSVLGGGSARHHYIEDRVVTRDTRVNRD